MLTEILVKGALEAVVGQGFKTIVDRIFTQQHGRSDRQILEAVLLEVHRHGGAIGNIETRLIQMEHEISRLRSNVPLIVGQHVSPLQPVTPTQNGYEAGAHFKQTSGGYMNFYSRSRKQ